VKPGRANSVRITFVLPGSGNRPVGGYRVVYEHASGLAAKGHAVIAVHAPVVQPHNAFALYVATALGYRGGVGPRRWMRVSPAIRLAWRPTLAPFWIPRADAVVATAWQTAEWVCRYPPDRGEKFYLIHDYEHFMTGTAETRARIRETLRAGMRNIVTSPAGEEMVRACDAEVHAYVPNGIDLDMFNLKLAAEDPQRTMIGFPFRTEPYKGTQDAVAALERVRREASGLTCWSWGWARRPPLPEWVTYYEAPSDAALASLYNRSQIMVIPSHYEGWGLPGAEAMACGAALASTDNVGVRAYARHGETALLSAPRNPALLADSVLALLAQPALRLRIARQGHQYIQQFSWPSAVARMEDVLRASLP
jgi:glycosyltransferase involved in cell wall biosynthesis